MLLFIVLNLALSYVVKANIFYPQFLTDRSLLSAGIIFLSVSILGALLKKQAYSIWYDLFASGATLIWFAYWHEFYLNDAPMFYIFPLFFAFLMASLALLIIGKREQLDQESLEYLQSFAEMNKFHPVLVASCVMTSLLAPGHYLLFPIAMGLLLLRFTLTSCLDAY